jgi:hypothetical protein
MIKSIFAIGILVFMLAGCSVDKTDTVTGKELSLAGVSNIEDFNLKLASQQIVTIVGYYDIKPWLNTNKKKIKIDAISSIDNVGHGSTGAFLIVYTPLPEEKVIEKTPKELALEKLTTEDKKALGISE